MRLAHTPPAPASAGAAATKSGFGRYAAPAVLGRAEEENWI
jgi:hypothetical protein